MTNNINEEEYRAYMDAAAFVDKIFPQDQRGKYARPMAKKLADNTDLTYEEAVSLVYNSCIIGIIDHLVRRAS